MHGKKRCEQCRRVLRALRSTKRFCGNTCRSLARYHRRLEVARHDWHTPPAVIQAARLVLGDIDVDPASCAIANATVQASRYFDPRTDGLRQPWTGRIWLNPPYGGHIVRWIAKLLAEYERGSITAAVVLVPARVDTRWFQQLDGLTTVFLAGRLRFNGAGTAPFPSAVVYLGDNPGRFVEVFGPWGRVWC